jgi:hypothetical protein
MNNLSHALIEKRPEWTNRHSKVILLYDNAQSHTSKLAKDTLKSLVWDILPPPPQSFDLEASDYHFFASMGHALAEQHFSNLEEVLKSPSECFWRGIHNLPKRWSKCVEADGQSLNKVKRKFP